MTRGRMTAEIVALAALLCLLGSALGASGPRQPTPKIELMYHALVPLGSESFAVQPWRSVLTILASAESPEFEGWRRERASDERGKLVNAAGEDVRYFPGQIRFRVSAGTRTRLSTSEPYVVRAGLPANDYLLKLRFRVKIFRGLHVTVVDPASVTMIGVPAEMPYDERIYRVTFDLRQVSIDDRIVLEVLAPSGERLCKFHLDLT